MTRPRNTLKLDRPITLNLLERFRRSAQARKGVACAVVVLGGSIFSPAYAYAPIKAQIQIKQMTPQMYAKANLPLTEYKCIHMLYMHESNWRVKARNGSHYGIPQGKSIYLKTASGVEQVKWGIKYNKNRYGSMCKAWHHYQQRNWH